MRDQVLLLALGVLAYAWLGCRALRSYRKKLKKDIIKLRLKRFVG